MFWDINSWLDNIRAHSSSFFACDNRTQSPAPFQIIFKFCTFLPKFSNILPVFWKIARMPLLSRIGPEYTNWL